MSAELTALLATAASIGFVHTVLGPDHYLPFVAMAHARDWSRMRTMIITILCGIGHVGSSVVLGLIGVAIGAAVTHLEMIESIRGDLAAWALIAFGLVYGVWGLRRAAKNLPHTHGPLGTHTHVHREGEPVEAHHHHVHEKANITPWVLFTVFVLGPCEPLIPILMYPAAQHSMSGMMLVTLVFGLTTIGTMLTIVLLALRGVKLLPMQKLERYSHALAGATILLCGVAIKMGM
jgi:nickel/cobalt transporter (NicO) family protein